jgi:hypothetical protein
MFLFCDQSAFASGQPVTFTLDHWTSGRFPTLYTETNHIIDPLDYTGISSYPKHHKNKKQNKTKNAIERGKSHVNSHSALIGCTVLFPGSTNRVCTFVRGENNSFSLSLFTYIEGVCTLAHRRIHTHTHNSTECIQQIFNSKKIRRVGSKTS